MSDDRPATPPADDGTDGPEAALPAEASPLEAQTSAPAALPTEAIGGTAGSTTDQPVASNEKPAAPPTPVRPSGLCVSCGNEVLLDETWRQEEGNQDPGNPRFHQLGPDRKAGRPFGKRCGPVFTEFLYNVFAWGPSGPIRLVMKYPRPCDGNAAPEILAQWEGALSRKFQVVDEKGVAVVGQHAEFVIQSWTPVGAR